MLFARTPLIDMQALIAAFGRDVCLCVCRTGNEPEEDLKEQVSAYAWYTSLPRPELIWPTPPPTEFERNPGTEIRVVLDTIGNEFSGSDFRFGWDLLEHFHGGNKLDTHAEFPDGCKREVRFSCAHYTYDAKWLVLCIPSSDLGSSADWYRDVLLPAIGLSNDITVVGGGKEATYPGKSIITESKASTFTVKAEITQLTIETSDRAVANRWVESFLKHESGIKWALEKQRLTAVMSFPEYQAWYPRLNAYSKCWFWNIWNGTRAEMLESGIVGDRIPLFEISDKLIVSKVHGRDGWFLEYTCKGTEKWLRTKLNQFPEARLEFWKGAPHERWG